MPPWVTSASAPMFAFVLKVLGRRKRNHEEPHRKRPSGRGRDWPLARRFDCCGGRRARRGGEGGGGLGCFFVGPWWGGESFRTNTIERFGAWAPGATTPPITVPSPPPPRPPPP